MKRVMLSAVTMTAIMGSVSTISAGGIDILSNVKWDGQIRARFESVDDGNNATANAQAFTARTKLKATGNLLEIPGLSASVGIISVNNFGGHKYNWNGTAYNDGTKPYSVVMDPQKAIISNAEINYKTCNTLVHAGRGQVNLDNQRFIGTVGWRQLERSYDSIFVANSAIPNLSLLAAWVYGFQGVKDIPTQDTNSILLHAAYDVNPNIKVTAYDYMIANAHDTYGLALTGKVNLGPIIKYRLEAAKQKDPTQTIHGANKPHVDADYFNVDLGTVINGVILGANYEFLSGQDTHGKTAFNPMLGTNHKFNGWADKFYVASVPLTGLKDANVRLGYKAPGFGKLLAVYHNFTGDTTMNGQDDLGSEIDVAYANKVPGYNNLKYLIKYADYSKGTVNGYTNDVKKGWIQLDYKF